MDPIPDLDALRTHLDSLAARDLIVWLSPPGRGRMLTHGLLPEEKLAKVRSQVGLAATSVAQATDIHSLPLSDDEPTRIEVSRTDISDEAHTLANRVAALESELAQVLRRLAVLEEAAGEG